MLLVELLAGRTGVGAAISLYFQLFDVRAVIGYAVAFGAVMLAIEFLVLQPLESLPVAGASTPLDVRIDLKRYRRADGTVVEAVRGLSLSLAPGRFTCLIGPSGCGKTTALRIAAGLDHDFEGTVSPDPRSLRLALMFQEPRRCHGGQSSRTSASSCRNRSGGSLSSLCSRRSGSNPGGIVIRGSFRWGFARRVALARALATEPDFLLLDEPFVSLDDAAAATLRGVLLAAFAERPIGIGMVTHNLREALAVADSLVLLAPRPSRVVARVDLGTPRPKRTGAGSRPNVAASPSASLRSWPVDNRPRARKRQTLSQILQ